VDPLGMLNESNDGSVDCVIWQELSNTTTMGIIPGFIYRPLDCAMFTLPVEMEAYKRYLLPAIVYSHGYAGKTYAGK
jgi:hypothetical protein